MPNNQEVIKFDSEGKNTIQKSYFKDYKSTNPPQQATVEKLPNVDYKKNINDPKTQREVFLSQKEIYLQDPIRYVEYFDFQLVDVSYRDPSGGMVVTKTVAQVLKSDEKIEAINKQNFKDAREFLKSMAFTNPKAAEELALFEAIDEARLLIKKIDKEKANRIALDASKKINDQKTLEEAVKRIVNRGDILNTDALIKDKDVWFRKSYSAFDSLTPYIRCYITTPELKLLDNKNTLKEIQKDYFEIPYNMIKSLELEFNASPGVAGTFILKLEDPTGIIGNIVVAQLYSLGILKNKDGVPRINIEFGWADKGLKKIINKKDYKRFFPKNHFTEYLILHSDIEFSEKFKQELTIKGNQDQVGILRLNNLEGENLLSPYKSLGSTPIENLKVIQYYHYFTKNKKNNYGLNIFNAKELSSPYAAIESLLKISIDNKLKNNIEDKENFLLATCRKKNNLFNVIDPQNELCNPVKTTFKAFLNRSLYHPYVIFCYVLNVYLMKIKTFYSNINLSEPDIYFLCYYDESKIRNFSTPSISFDEYSIKNVTENIRKINHPDILNNDFLIQPNETWGGLLQRLATNVKMISKEKKGSEPNLYFEINRFVPDSKDKLGTSETSSLNDLFSPVSLNTFSIDILINKFIKIEEFYSKKNINKNTSDKIKNELVKLDERKKSNKSFIYIIITAGSAFLTEENYPAKPILQSYTVFPYIQQDNRLEYQNFNSGSKSFVDESYPDVISFRPKVDLNNIINANFKINHPINFHNGVVKYSEKTFYLFEDIKINNKKVTSSEILDNIKNIISELTTDNTKDKKIVTFNALDNNYYTVNKNVILFYHQRLSSFFEGKKNVTLEIDIGKNQKKNQLIDLVEDVRNEFDNYSEVVLTGYHFSVLNSLIKKSKRVFPGNNNMSDFYAYSNSANEYNKLLNVGAKGFEAELKILGEPAFTYDFGQLSYILIKVNNFDGSPNHLFSGIYSLKKIKHHIENGKFETTITLMYDSAWGS